MPCQDGDEILRACLEQFRRPVMVKDLPSLDGRGEENARHERPAPRKGLARQQACREIDGKAGQNEQPVAREGEQGMNQGFQAKQKRAFHRVGRQRLQILLMGLGGGSCAVAMALVLILYGTPYNPMWWWVMGAILLAVCALSGLLAPVVEWTMDGYMRDRAQNSAEPGEPTDGAGF